MEKSKKSHIVKLCLIALFFLITPLLSSSIRPAYLYLLLNLLIIAIGAEAGLLSFLNPQEDKPIVTAPKPIDITARVITATELSPIREVDDQVRGNNYLLPKIVEKKVRKVEKSMSAKVVSAVKVRTLMKSPSTPSLFFIGGEDTEAEETLNEFEGKDEDECLSGQELYTKAENFIGNFYKQLKIQREDSWRKIHDLYHKTF
ncbi:hypothetical protein FRX31_023815 [Thalictrum thalictroides]|uniref:DUF4408 domain-containing protein n=1 Tax=Thalictrum thalictroides TaxID=46969 RepID=A0A7J6VPV9_THATH|nr:hypothetical protein FRX31_023815 [Thalictrum thalictroides]